MQSALSMRLTSGARSSSMTPSSCYLLNLLTHVKPDQLLNARRAGDSNPDLWTVFNRVQENVIRGGLDNFGYDANNRYRRGHTRQVKGLDQSTALNRALWTLGEEMAKLKTAG